MDPEDLQESRDPKAQKVRLVLQESLVTWDRWVELETVAPRGHLENLVKMVILENQDELVSRDS